MWDQAVIAAVCTGAALLIREAVGQYVTARKAGREGGSKQAAAEQRRRQQDQEFQADQYRRLVEQVRDAYRERIDRLEGDLGRAHAQIDALERHGALPIDPADSAAAKQQIRAIAQGENEHPA